MEILNQPFLLLPLGLLLGVIGGFLLRKRFVENHRANIENQGKQLIENAIAEAERIKKDAVLHSKEVVYQLKQAVEEEIRADKDDIKDERRQLSEKKEQLKREAESLGKRQDEIQKGESSLRQQEEGLQKKNNEVEQLLLRQRNELEKIAGIGREEAKKLLMDSMESEARMQAAKKLARIENEMKMEADKKGKNILALAISRYAGDYVADKTVSMVPLPNDEMKGRIIGREGRNIRAIEAATGIDIIIDDTPEAVILSGFNPVRREVARLALLQLINDGRIHPARIEEVVAKVTKELEVTMREAGEQATFDVGAHGVHVELINLLDR